MLEQLCSAAEDLLWCGHGFARGGKLFSIIRGKKADMSEDVRKLLRYMKESSVRNADGEWL